MFGVINPVAIPAINALKFIFLEVLVLINFKILVHLSHSNPQLITNNVQLKIKKNGCFNPNVFQSSNFTLANCVYSK